jgi:hypothetical protein
VYTGVVAVGFEEVVDVVWVVVLVGVCVVAVWLVDVRVVAVFVCDLVLAAVGLVCFWLPVVLLVVVLVVAVAAVVVRWAVEVDLELPPHAERPSTSTTTLTVILMPRVSAIAERRRNRRVSLELGMS